MLQFYYHYYHVIAYKHVMFTFIYNSHLSFYDKPSLPTSPIVDFTHLNRLNSMQVMHDK